MTKKKTVTDDAALVLHKNYKQLLTLCENPRSLVNLVQIMNKLSHDTVRRYCGFLCTQGYMERTMLPNVRVKVHYQSLKAEYPLELIVIGSSKASGIKRRDAELSVKLPGAVTYYSEDRASKYQAQAEATRKERKSPKHSGIASSMSMFV